MSLQSRHVRWLLDELPRLVAEGTLTDDAAERLRARYREAARSPDRTQLALLVFGVLGAALVGSGLILLLAHNWEDLTRPVRAGLSIALLALGQIAAGWALWRRPGSAAWIESTTTFATLALGASIALVSQTYHIEGSLHAFLLSWLLPVLPLVYLARARVPAALCAVGVVVWTNAAPDDTGLWGLVLAAVLAPFAVALARRSEGEWRDGLAAWAFALSIPLAGLAHLFRVEGRVGLFFEAAVIGALCAVGLCARSGRRAYATAGAFAWLALSLILGFEGPWRHLRSWSLETHDIEAWGLGLLGVALSALCLVAAIRFARRADWSRMLLVALPFAVGLALAVASPGGPTAAMWVYNAYFLTTGAAAVAVGLRDDSLETANAGLVALVGLFTTRFFDADLSFVVRGLAFIVLGIGFLAVNLQVLWRRRRATS